MHRALTVFVILLTLLTSGCSSEPDRAAPATAPDTDRTLVFGGGPSGGTFNFFANKIASLITVRNERFDVTPRNSGGSAENLRSLNRRELDMGIVYSGDAYLGRNGKLPGDPTHYDRVRALGYLYGAPAQLVVHADSTITTAAQLAGKRLAVGNPGSGAALSAERFFRHLGIWDAIEVRKLGYTRAAEAFSNGDIDAFWVLVGYPNSSIIGAAANQPIRLIDLHAEARRSGFYAVYPFYSKVTIPAATYQGQDEPVTTFQDAALWCASQSVSVDAVFQSLATVYSEEGIAAMIAAHKAAGAMTVSNGLHGVSIPLHPGAVRFWKEQELTIPPKLLP